MPDFEPQTVQPVA